jgi:hypothetical protein
VLAALDKDPQRRPGARMLLARLVGGFGQDPVTAATQVVQSTWTMPRFPRPAAPPAADQPATVPVAPMGSMGPVGAAGGAGPAWPAQD